MHDQAWSWGWTITPDERPRPGVAVWSRGVGKSAHAEALVATWAARRQRRYVLYVCGKQAKANEHVQNIAGLLVDPTFARDYPLLAQRRVNQYNQSQGWTQSLLNTADGFVVEAYGLDALIRGVRRQDARPDAIVLDDLDASDDGPDATDRKLQRLALDILPTGADGNVAVFVAQNLIITDGVVGRIIGDRPPILGDRLVFGPWPAVAGLTWVWPEGAPYATLTGGTPTWAGLDLAACQRWVQTIGISAFLSEYQHQPQGHEGELFRHAPFRVVEPADVPPLRRVVCWLDPALTDTHHSDSNGICIAGLGHDGVIYVLWSFEARGSAEQVLRLGLLQAMRHGCETIGVETDAGGDLWFGEFDRVVARLAAEDKLFGRLPEFTYDRAGRTRLSKAERVSRMVGDHETGHIAYVRGTHEVAIAALQRFDPDGKRGAPYDYADSQAWCWADLRDGWDGPRGELAAVALEPVARTEDLTIRERRERALRFKSTRRGR